MAMTRQERIALHKKQERLQVKDGVPSLNDLVEGVPVIRSTPEGLVEYVRYKGELYKKVLDRVLDTPKVEKDILSELIKDKNVFISNVKISQSGGSAGDLLHFRDETDKRDLVVRYNGEAYEYRTEVGGAGKVLMTFEDGGNVGIGTTSPGSKLSVVGLPSSAAGLSAGDIYISSGTLKIVE